MYTLVAHLIAQLQIKRLKLRFGLKTIKNSDLTDALAYINITSGAHANTPIPIDAQYLTNEYEFKIVSEVEISNTKHRQSLVVVGGDLFNPIMNATYTEGGYANAQYNEYCQWISRANNKTLILNAFYINGTDCINNAYTYVKCRKA